MALIDYSLAMGTCPTNEKANSYIYAYMIICYVYFKYYFRWTIENEHLPQVISHQKFLAKKLQRIWFFDYSFRNRQREREIFQSLVIFAKTPAVCWTVNMFAIRSHSFSFWSFVFFFLVKVHTSKFANPIHFGWWTRNHFIAQ